MPYYFCQWNDDIIAYLSLHGISPEDFEFVVQQPQSVTRSHSSQREIAFGYTASGEYIACLYEWINEDTLVPITAYPVPEKS